jgi:RHS repeat-associated protein
MGRRIEKAVTVKVKKDWVTSRYQYLYDGLDIVQELKDGTVTANYVRTLNIDEPLARLEADGTVRYYHADALGSVTALTDASGAVQTRYKYESFGKIEITLDDGHGALNPFRYTGRELDETGDYYYRARYYAPEVGRFVSEDPIGLAGGINKFVFVKNMPTRYKDPFGLINWPTLATGMLLMPANPFVGGYLASAGMAGLDVQGAININWGQFAGGAVLTAGGMVTSYLGLIGMGAGAYAVANTGGIIGLAELLEGITYGGAIVATGYYTVTKGQAMIYHSIADTPCKKK